MADGVGDEGCEFGGCQGVEGIFESVEQHREATRLTSSQGIFHDGEDFLDCIEFGVVRRDVERPSTRILEHLGDGIDVVEAHVVHDDDVAVLEVRSHMVAQE